MTAVPANDGERFARAALIAPWLRSPATVWAMVHWNLVNAGHVVAFHALRLPAYWWRLTLRSPVGVWRLLCAWSRWVTDADGRLAQRAVIDSLPRREASQHKSRYPPRFRGGGVVRGHLSVGDHPDHGPARNDSHELRAQREARERYIRRRWGYTAAVVLPLFVALAAVWLATTPPERWAVGMLVLPVFGFFGREVDQPIIGHATDGKAEPWVTGDLLLEAFRQLPIAGLKGSDNIRFIDPVTPHPDGWSTVVALPPPVVAADVIKVKDRYAGCIGRPANRVHLEQDGRDASAVRVWIGKQAIGTGAPVVSAYLDGPEVDVYEPFRIGDDVEGRPALLDVSQKSGVIAGISGEGKSSTLRGIGCFYVSDPRSQVGIWSFKGGPDYDELRPLAHAYYSGASEENVRALRDYLLEMVADKERRYSTFEKLPAGLRPDKLVTSAVASDPEYGLHPRTVLVDESHVGFRHPVYGLEILRLMADLGKTGRAVNVTAWAGTQRPTLENLPPDFLNVTQIQIGHRLHSVAENINLFGPASYGEGIRATELAAPGMAIVTTSNEGARTIRVAYLNGPDTERIAQPALQRRTARGAVVATQQVESAADRLLRDVAAVWPAGERAVWSETLAPLLGATSPARYGGWTGAKLSAALRPAGVAASGVRIDGRNRNGYRRSDLDIALSRLPQHAEPPASAAEAPQPPPSAP